ncbi:uncharacterized protein MISFA isoform X1 [Balaenoptera acutorostrata]|uniref:Uncharacterized protein MISFA isoform X1 n=1 Tax=Balaenoptera acutorostrata TaxID=9767 RepID=A0ABM3U242_BALAC|nr:uncharacterized protein MISFA isoform X1 [Balaenoptera acutorostrata]
MSSAPGSARLRPESHHRSSANPERVQKRVSAKGTTTQLAGGKLGDIGEDRNRKDPRRSSKGGTMWKGYKYPPGGTPVEINTDDPGEVMQL